MNIVLATLADWPEIRKIYREGILTNNATFSTVEDIPDSAETWFAGKLDQFVTKAVAEDGSLLGWGSLSPSSKRRVYRGVVEDSVYVASSASGQGVGHALLADLIERSEADGIWTLYASIFPENGASVHIHKKCGFRMIGTREKVAQQHGVWRDVVLMERRSTKIG